jgi:V/A-type H+/Na+-transporting ATPase subunit E
MSQQIQALIEKIKSEGVQEAEQKALEIKQRAQKEAEEIIAQAKKEAAKLVADAEAKGKKTEANTHAALRQAARDMLLKLRKEIDATLRRVIGKTIEESLSPENLSELIIKVLLVYAKQATEGAESVVSLSEKDYKKMKDSFLAKLKEAVKQPLTLRSEGNIRAGFTISFDAGKSSFDFTDQSLVEYLSVSLSKDVAAVLKDTGAA